jgi:hypothetical protein
MHRLTGARWSVSSLSPGALEAAHALVFGEVVSLSEQQLVDCAGAFDTFGCNGGLPSHAFEYVRYGCARGSPYPPALSSSQTQSHQYAGSFQVGGGAVVRGHASADVVSEGVCGGGMQCVLGPSGLSGEQK